MWIGSEAHNRSKPLGLKLSQSSVKCLGVWCNTDVDKAITENFEEKIKKLKKLLGMWHQRNLSLKGKIAVLCSVLYVTSVLYTPQWVIDEVENLMFKFLWNDRKPHVKKEVVINEIAKGGLKMPHFASMVKAIKCTWIKRILNASDCKLALIKSFIKYRNMDIIDIIKCKLDCDHMKFTSVFYEQIFASWFEVYSAVRPQEILYLSLWHNRHITIGKKTVYFVEWKNKGISLLKHIMDNNRKILSKGNIEDTYGLKIKQMDYNSLIDAITSMWKNNVIRCNEKENMNNDIVVYCNQKGKTVNDTQCKDYYWHFVDKICEPPKGERKWLKYANVNVEDWSEYHQLPYNVTRDTAIQSMQYKVLHRFFPCNYILSVWYKDLSDKCSYCEETDHIEHYFYKCTSLELFWHSIENWWLNNLGSTIRLNVENAVFGLTNPNKDSMIDIFNYCILLAKWHISESRKKNYDPSLYDYLRLLKYRLDMVKVSYALENDNKTFEEKWSVLYNCI